MPLDFPNTPTIGQQFSAGTTAWVWDGTAWNIVPQMTPAIWSDLPPANPAVGQFWMRATNGQLYIWTDDGNSKQWVQAAGQAATPGLWEPIGTGLYTGVGISTVLLQNLGAYRDIRMKWKSEVATGGDQPVYMQHSSDNGATWAGAAGQYAEQLHEVQGTVATGAVYTSSSVIALIGTSTGSHAAYDLWFTNFNTATTNTWFEIIGDRFHSTNNILSNRVSGYDTAVAARNALKIYIGGTMNFHCTVEGVRG